MVFAVVFGRVLEGMPVVRSIEAMGSSSGKTRQRVAIADCGELPSRRQILAKMAAEKEALANMKKDPLQVHIASASCIQASSLIQEPLRCFRTLARMTITQVSRLAYSSSLSNCMPLHQLYISACWFPGES